MTVLRIKRGTGVTARAVLTLAGAPGDIRDTLRQAVASASPEAQLAAIEQEARDVLANADAEETAEDAPGDFAIRILRRIAVVRGALARSDAALTTRHALALGRLVTEAAIKSEWEQYALQGAAYSRRQARCGKARKNMNLARDVEMASEFRRRQRKRDSFGGGISDTGIMRQVGRLPRFNLRKSAAIAAINRGLKQMSGHPGSPD